MCFMKPFRLLKFKYARENCLFTRQGAVSKSVDYNATVDPEHELQTAERILVHSSENSMTLHQGQFFNSNKIHS